MVQYKICLGITFGFLTIMLRFLKNISPCWLDVMYELRSSVCARSVSLGLDEQCRRAFGLKQEAYLRWTRDRSRVNWEESVRCQVRANETYSDPKHQFSDRNRDVVMNVQTTHKRWYTLTSVVFGSSSLLPPLVGGGGELVCESVGKADRL